VDNSDGSANTAIGAEALYYNTEGDYNTALGRLALTYNKTGENNVGIGYQSLYLNSSGSANIAIGAQAMLNSVSGHNNIAAGYQSLYYNTSGGNNTAAGIKSLFNNTTGNNNTAYGSRALSGNKTGINNTAVGADASDLYTGLSNTTALGYDALPDASNKVRIGNTSVTSIGGQVGWTNFSDERVKKDIKENVPGLQFIKALRAVTYHYNIAKENELLGRKNDTANWEGKHDLEKINFSGFLAQEVDAAAKKIGYDFSGVDKTGKIMGLRYAEFVVPLVKAVQELSNENEELKERLRTIEEMLATKTTTETNNTVKSSMVEPLTLARLEQNTPNPSNGNTVIRYSIPLTVKHASLVITNMQGQLIKSYSLNNGTGQLTIAAGQLSSGNYTYSLIVDGKKVDSKQMMISK
jgi:hypothetical protein